MGKYRLRSLKRERDLAKNYLVKNELFKTVPFLNFIKLYVRSLQPLLIEFSHCCMLSGAELLNFAGKTRSTFCSLQKWLDLKQQVSDRINCRMRVWNYSDSKTHRNEVDCAILQAGSKYEWPRFAH